MPLKKILLIILPVIFVILAIFVAVQAKSKLANQAAEKITDLSGELKPEEKIAYWNGQKIDIPTEVFLNTPTAVLGATNEEKWIEVDLSEQKLTAYEGSNVFLSTPISSGLPWTPTPTGEFWIWIKLRATRMEGGEGKYYYNLPNVPYVMFFQNASVPSWKGYGLHGTYWHNDFGNPHSHGCVNLPTAMAEKLYYWTSPTIPEGKNLVYASDTDPGTKIVIHD